MKKLNCILLIDDNPLDNRYHQIIFKEMDIAHRVRVADNGQEAIAILKEKDNPLPELIFLDINMPKMNGWEFLMEYKKLDIDRSNTKVVILTTSENPADLKRAQSNPGITAFRVKPLDEEFLNRIILTCFTDSD